MNDYQAALIIGVVEGLTEFLPVSSTAHIRFTQELLGLPIDQDNPITEYWKMFAVVIQLGAILSVVVYFWKRLSGFFHTFMGSFDKDRDEGEQPEEVYGVAPKPWWRQPLAFVFLSFVITAVPCFLIDKKIGENLESLKVMGWALIVGGIVMWLVDSYFSRRATTESMEEMTLMQSIVIGLMQIFAAAFPGTSRSMSTIAGGQIMGLNRSTALEFSFFLSIPVMFAATGYKLLQFLVKQPVAMDGHQWITLMIGFFTSFIVALLVIAWFMTWVQQRGFLPFAIYRIIAGIAVLIWLVK